jgi:hypothetical protein
LKAEIWIRKSDNFLYSRESSQVIRASEPAYSLRNSANFSSETTLVNGAPRLMIGKKDHRMDLRLLRCIITILDFSPPAIFPEATISPEPRKGWASHNRRGSQ